MRNIVLYIAMSLDGYIADEAGGGAWLEGDGSAPDAPGSWPAFYEGVGDILMGRATYQQVATELAPGAWPYQGKRVWVFTHRPAPPHPGVSFTGQAPAALAAGLKARPGGDIWVCGGASLAGQLAGAGLIDRYHISVIPALLGRGVPLFPPGGAPAALRLVSTRQYNGIVDLVYERR